MAAGTRDTNWECAKDRDFDVVIIGGGINGASLFYSLGKKGYKVLLIDKSDFASGTSQASAMMVWGGLLYMRDLEFGTVFRLCADRDRMLRELQGRVSPCEFRFIPLVKGDLSSGMVRAALHLYWALGLFRRKPPFSENEFRDRGLLKPGIHGSSLVYEEAALDSSDCRFTLGWIAPHTAPATVALNYCSAEGAYSRRENVWQLCLKDNACRRETRIRARLVANCAGVWADRVNGQFGIESPFRHALSKGVFIGIERPASHDSILIFEMGSNKDALTLMPWGPVSLWGPTETFPESIEDGFTAAAEDIRFLLENINLHLDQKVDASRIVSVRCGVRPLAVKKDFHRDCYPLDLSRRQEIVMDGDLPWVSIYGGKLTGCRETAAQAARKIASRLHPAGAVAKSMENADAAGGQWIEWPGLEQKVPAPQWCARQEFCCTLEDYLRRRTNISQWVPRQGLGRDNEHAGILVRAAQDIYQCGRSAAEAVVGEYREQVECVYDRVLEQV